MAGLFYIFDIAHYRNKHIEKIARKIPFEQSAMAGILFGFTAKIAAMDSNLFKEVVKVPFENIEACVVKDYDTYLRNLYGNYMTPPPVDQQVGHHYNKGFSLEMGYEEYLKKNKI